MTRAADLRPGDCVDLDGDPIADPGRNQPGLEFELAVVGAVVREAPDCVAVYFDGYPGWGFPPGHLLPVHGRDGGYGES